MSKTEQKKISDALELLDEIAESKKEDVVSMINGKYSNFKQALSDVQPQLKEAQNKVINMASESVEMSQEKAKQIANQVDRDVHTRPWVYIAGAAIGGLCLGLFSKSR